MATIDPARCDRSPGCPVRRVCPQGAVYRLESGGRPGAWAIDPALCSGCGSCVRVCPTGAVTMITSER